MTQDKHHYHLPVRPFSPIDALNRRAAAVGSTRYAELAGHANYNGHHVTVSFNEYRKYYIAGYFWAGHITLARGAAEHCVAAAVEEYNRGALGASVAIALRGEDVDHIVGKFVQLVPGTCKFAHETDWYTWRHECAAQAARDAANPRLPVMIFDWPLMQAAADRAAYETALKAKYGRINT